MPIDSRPWSQTGRPSAADSQARTRELIRHLADGASFADAARLARVKPDRVLRLLDEPEFRAVAQAVLEGRMGPTVVVVDASATPLGAAA